MTSPLKEVNASNTAIAEDNESLNKPNMPGRSLTEQKALEELKKLAPEDQAAAFFSAYGKKLIACLEDMGAKQIRRAIVHSLGMPRADYKPKEGSNEAFVKWAIDRLVEIKTAMQLEVMYAKLGDAEKEFEKGLNLEDNIIEQETKRLEEQKQNAELSAEKEK